MPLHLERCLLLAALLLSATCSTAAADGDDAEPAHFFNKINTTVCTDNACPAGQYAAPTGSSVECKPCPVGSFKGADGKGCCEACKLPELTFNVSNGDFVVFGATGCSCRQGTYKNTTLPHTRCLRCPKGSVADWGASSCTACVPPRTPSTLRDKCVEPCPAGTMIWKGTCTNCTTIFPKPAANPDIGGICKLCNVGTNSTNGITCNSCLTGYSNTGNATNAVCNTCVENYYNPRWWQWRVQQQKRQASASNWDFSWPVFCKPCPANTFSPGNNTQAKCCPAGQKYNDATNKCFTP